MIKEEKFSNCKSDFYIVMEGDEKKEYKINYDDFRNLEKYLGGIVLWNMKNFTAIFSAVSVAALVVVGYGGGTVETA